MVDLSRVAFGTSLVTGVLGLTFFAGIYSAYKDNAVASTIYGVYQDTKTLIKELPNLIHSRPANFLRPALYKGSGVTVNKTTTDDLVLLSGFIRDDQKVELMRRDGTILATWRLLPREMLPNPNQCRKPPQTDWNSAAHNTIIHPDGSIVFSFESCGMVKLDRCGKKLWATREITHHSPNWLSNGGIVIGGGDYVTERAPWPFLSPYWEDVVRKFDANGKQVAEKHITGLFLKNGLASLLTSNSQDDPKVNGEFHLNEVEELPAQIAPAFPMFQPGDLLISIRNLNMILVTDANVEKVKWYKIGPWIRQHDPDWQPDGKITVFDNHPSRGPDGRVDKGSQIVEIDPATGKTQFLYGRRKGQSFSTVERGLHQMQPDGGILITEANNGRAFQVDRSGKLVWEYVNRYDDDEATWLNGVEAYPRSYFKVTNWACH